jgi:hypothetical protein
MADDGYGPEGPNVKRARFTVGRITKLEHKLHLMRVELPKLEHAIVDETRTLESQLAEATRRGEEGWSNEWANYWRRLGIPCNLKLEEVTLAT